MHILPLLAQAQSVWNISKFLFSNMWSNMFAPSVWTILGFIISDIKSHIRVADLKSHHATTLDELAGQIKALSDKVGVLIGGKNDDSQQPG